MEKSLWEAQQASEAVDDADDELARLMADLEALDTEKDQDAIAAKQKEVEASQAQAAELKKVAAEKAVDADAAIKAKAKEVQKIAAESQAETEKLITATKALRTEAAAAMQEAKMASAEYQSALSSGQLEGLAALEATAKQSLKKAEALSEKAGKQGLVAKAALDNAAQVKKQSEKAVEMETENVQRLSTARLTWAGGPIFDKMKKLCKLDYQAFKKEYRLLRDSPSYARYRWDIKAACKTASEDEDLEADVTIIGDHEESMTAAEAVHKDRSKPYPETNTHWTVPADKKVKKWCSTKFGTVPCAMLEKAQAAGLIATDTLGEDADAGSSPGSSFGSDLDAAPDLVDLMDFEYD